jgi:hypothetical protein
MSFDLRLRDFNLNLVNGDLELVRGTEKLLQDILKLLFTKIGANPLCNWYGSYLTESVIGTANIDPLLMRSIAQTQISNSLTMLKKLQDSQLLSYQNVLPSEQIAGIKSVDVSLNINDPREYIITVSVLTKDLQQVSTQFNIGNN